MSVAAFQAHLATGSTTRARCWRLTRRDGAVAGFTDHDRPLAFEGVTFEPDSALAPSQAMATLGLGADDQDIMGALSSDTITEADLARGAYDGAEVAVWDVNWADLSARVLVAVYTLGEVERTESSFRAEIRTRSATLTKRAGRFYSRLCDAELGDSRCGVDVTGSPFLEAGAVASVGGPDWIRSTDLSAAPVSGYFDGGRLEWLTGANSGLVSIVRQHIAKPAARRLYLWRVPPYPIQPGDGFRVRAGCDKAFGTCVAKFANGANFRGAPHMPGEAYPLRSARSGRARDGGSANPPPAAPPPVNPDPPDAG